MARLAYRGKETRNDGSTIKEYNFADPYDAAQLLLIGAGFNDADVSRQQKFDWAQRQAFEFHATRASILINQSATAKLARDREGIADMKKAVKNYNDTVPFSGLRIKPVSIKKATIALKKRRRFKERGIPEQKKNRQLGRELNRLYPIEEEGVR